MLEYPKGAGNPEIIRSHIKNIRKKIEIDKSNPKLLTHISKKGYILDISKESIAIY